MNEKKPTYTMKDLECLNEAQAQVISLREGLYDGKKYSFIEIAEKLGKKTKQDAQQCYVGAIKRLEASKSTSKSEEDSGNTLKAAVEEILKMYPTLAWVPNLAQRRIIAPWSKPPYPKMVVASCGNGVGKTNVLPQDLAGCLLGPEFLNDCWNKDQTTGAAVGMTMFQYYHDCKHLRDAGKFQYRLLCGPEDMKEGGSLLTEIKAYIPTARFSGKTSTGSYKQIDIPHPTIAGIKNIVDIKTFEQDTTTHAGPTLHRIGINEPPPFDVFAETFARTREKKSSNIEATVLLNATILDKATWVFDLENDERFAGRVLFIQGSMWENCCGEEITEDIAATLFEKIGVRLEKNKNGKGYITYGQLTRRSIDDQIAMYDRTDPQQIDARIWGANVQLFGSEFKEYNSNVHVIPSAKIPKNVPIVQVVDPHPVKPDLCGYFYLDYMNKVRWFQDWPTIPWEKLKGRDKSIEQTCAEWKELEDRLGISDQIVVRVGDPNRFKTPDSRDLMQLWCLYAPFGFTFNLFVSDNLEVGHQEIHSRLSYNKKLYQQDPLDPRSWPEMTFADTGCDNLKTAMKFYGRKANKDPMAALTEQLDKKYKDAMDIIRYGSVFVKNKSIHELIGLTAPNGSDYQKVLQSRSVDNFDDNDSGIPSWKLKGSELVSVGRM